MGCSCCPAGSDLLATGTPCSKGLISFVLKSRTKSLCLGILESPCTYKPNYCLRNGVWQLVRTTVRVPPDSPPSKEPLRKPKTPQGRFDEPEQPNVGKDPLERFPDDINPVTKEKGGPRGPEPTRYGDWERKGRCIDF
uniref:Succinate dehydrogenase assembly factor 4, mitochondrial n=1 Tax=Leptobrachium leishanense TaxID=445787 RepID=A0A8C5QW98_9ANUR